MTKPGNIIVLSAAFIISAAIWMTAFYARPLKREKAIRARIFYGVNGWGYDILVNDRTFIHQESVPVQAGIKGFPEKVLAEQAAELIINKMKRGEQPSLTTFELNQLFSSTQALHDKSGKPY